MDEDDQTQRCRLCGSAAVDDLGVPAYRRPWKVAAVPIDISDLQLSHCRCKDCGYRFVDPPVPESRLLACYTSAASSHWTTDERVFAERSYASKKHLLQLHAPGKQVLDVGCYDGGFLMYLGDEFRRFGVEPSASAAKVAEDRGITILGRTLDDAEFHGLRFDAIVIFDVLEHLLDPVSMLRQLANLLSPRGIILIETGDSDAWRGAGRLHPYCGLVEHVGFFNRTSINKAATLAGLSTIHFERTAHYQMSRAAWAKAQAKNAAYVALRFARGVGIPLSVAHRQLAEGPFPRSLSRRDHFIAVLQKGA